MFINIIQNEVLLSIKKLISVFGQKLQTGQEEIVRILEINLMQENRDRDLKKLIKGMGANKTDKARAVGGLRNVMQNFDTQAVIHAKSTAHGHNLHVQMSLKS